MLGAFALLHPPAGTYTLPALRHPTLLFVLRGALAVQPPDSADAAPLPLGRAGLCGATRQARRVCASPGTRLLLAAVRPGQLQRLLGITAEEVLDAFLPLQHLQSAAASLLDALHTVASDADADAGAAITSFLARCAAEYRHHAAGLAVPDDQLNVPVSQLAAAFNLSLRQFERRFRQSHGQSLRAWRAHTRHNAMLCATLQGRPGPTTGAICRPAATMPIRPTCVARHSALPVTAPAS